MGTALLDNSKINIENERILGKLIQKFQQAHKTNNQQDKNKYLNKIYDIYNPNDYKYIWLKKYGNLYDTAEDFEQEYMIVFLNVLLKWKPVDARRKTEYIGSGDFKNLFWTALDNNFINVIKRQSAGKRNITVQCPVCDKWVSPLSTHILKKHHSLMWDKIKSLGYGNVENLSDCPLCKTYRKVRKTKCSCENFAINCETCLKKTNIENIKKHLISKHSIYLFEYFNDIYPDNDTLPSKVSSIYIEDNNNAENITLYDTIETTPTVSNLYDLSLTPEQQKIVDDILNSNKLRIIKGNKNEINDLKNKMHIVGLE